MTHAVVRRIGPEEAPAWREIRLAALSDAPEAFATKFADWQARPLADFAAQCADNPTFIAFEGRVPVGSAVWTRDGEIPGRAWLVAVYLLPGARGRGLGQTLIAAVLADARRAGMAEIWLEVAAGSLAAQAAYRRAGFVEAALPPGRRRCGIDDLAMRLTLG